MFLESYNIFSSLVSTYFVIWENKDTFQKNNRSPVDETIRKNYIERMNRLKLVGDIKN